MKTNTYKTAGTLALQADIHGADTTGGAPKPAIQPLFTQSMESRV